MYNLHERQNCKGSSRIACEFSNSWTENLILLATLNIISDKTSWKQNE